MTPTWISECLSRIRGARVGVFGDFALEGRWEQEGDAPDSTRRIREQRYVLAGAGNIAANAADLGANAVHAAGLVGDDLFGWHLQNLLRERGVRCDGMLRIQRDWQTPAHGLALRQGHEVERLEFGSFNQPQDVTLDRLADALDRLAAWCDVVIIFHDLPAGLGTPDMVARINRVISRHARCVFLVDDGRNARIYRSAMLKLDQAGWRRIGQVAAAADDTEIARQCAADLHRQTSRPVFVTHLERGVIVADAAGLHEGAAPPLPQPSNSTNFEQTATAAIAAILAGGGDTVAAARFATLASRVTAAHLDGPATVTPDAVRRLSTEPMRA